MKSWRVWIEATRPRTLAAAVIPVLVATALAASHHRADPVAALICLVFALLIQVGTNFANDYFDFIHGADTSERVGPRRAVSSGLVTPSAMRTAMILVFLVAFAAGLLLIARGGWILLPIGIACIVSGIAYTGGPWPLGYRGLGDLFVFIFFGLVAVCATFYVQAGFVGPDALLTGIAIGALSANILVANNYRDAETDARAGKRTLVVRFGRPFAVWQYGLSHLIAIGAAMALRLFGHGKPVLVLLLLAPWAFVLTRRLARSTDPVEQIAVLAATAMYLAVFGIMLSLAVVSGRT